MQDDVDGVKNGIAAIVQYYVITDREVEGIARCRPLIEKVASLPGASSEMQAFVLNQQQMLHYGAKQYNEALELAERVLKLVDNVAAYHFNIALIYDKLGLTQKQLEAVDRYMKMDKSDEDHLRTCLRRRDLADGWIWQGRLIPAT